MSEKMKLADLVSRVTDYGTPRFLRTKGFMVRVITYHEISDGGIIDFTRIGSDPEGRARGFDPDTLNTGDILISRSDNLTGVKNVKIAVIPEEGRGCTCDRNSFALSLKPGIIKPELVAAYLSSRPIQEYIMKLSNDKIFRDPPVLYEKILDLEITVPEKEKQEKMAECIALLKESYTKMKERIIQMESVKTAVVSELFGDGKC